MTMSGLSLDLCSQCAPALSTCCDSARYARYAFRHFRHVSSSELEMSSPGVGNPLPAIVVAV